MSHDADAYHGQQSACTCCSRHIGDSVRRDVARNTRIVPDAAAAEPEVTSHGGRRRLAMVALWEKMAES